VRELRAVEIVGMYETQREALEVGLSTTPVSYMSMTVQGECGTSCWSLDDTGYGCDAQTELAVLRAEVRTMAEQLRDEQNQLAIQVQLMLI
jgi:hypothetical protein